MKYEKNNLDNSIKLLKYNKLNLNSNSKLNNNVILAAFPVANHSAVNCNIANHVKYNAAHL